MNFIKKWIWKRNAIKAAQLWHDDCEGERIWDVYQSLKELAQVRRALFKIKKADYVEYVSEGKDAPYSFTSTRNVAENLVLSRLRAKYGDKKMPVVEMQDVAHPYDSIEVMLRIAHGSENSIRTRRIYYWIKDEKENK